MLNRLSKLLFIAGFLIALLVLGKQLLIPLAFAVLISFLLYPISKYFEKKLPRLLAVSIIFTFASSLVLGAGILVASSLQTVMADMKNFQSLFTEFIENSTHSVAVFLGISEQAIGQTIENNIGSLLGGSMSFFTKQVFNSGNFLFSALVTGVLTFLMLLYRTVFKNFFMSQLAEEKRKEGRSLLYKIQAVSQNYLVGLFLVMLLLGLLNSVGLWLIGIEYAIFWGYLAAILAIVPYAGTFIGGLLPLIYAIITTATVWQPIGVILWFMVVQFLEDNLIKPKIVGNQIDLNPFTAIIALMVGGIVWGIPGFVLALPFMAIIKIILEHFNETAALATLFGSEIYDTPKVFKKQYSSDKYSLRNFLDPKEK